MKKALNNLAIQHVWFDFSETIVFLQPKKHNELRYRTYAEIVKKPITEQLKTEYEELYKEHKQSNAAIFRLLGTPADFWSNRVNAVDPKELYKLADSNIPKVLEKLHHIVPISIFSNIELTGILPSFGIQPEWFSHLLSSKTLKKPKPAHDGFKKMIELSRLPAHSILYIGDNLEKDVRPAREVGIQTGLIWKKSSEADYSFQNFSEIMTLLQSK